MHATLRANSGALDSTIYDIARFLVRVRVRVRVKVRVKVSFMVKVRVRNRLRLRLRVRDIELELESELELAGAGQVQRISHRMSWYRPIYMYHLTVVHVRVSVSVRVRYIVVTGGEKWVLCVRPRCGRTR